MSEQPHSDYSHHTGQETPYQPNPGYQPPIPPPYEHQPQQQEPKGMAITALVLGILAVVFCLIPILGFPLGVTALILGIMSFRRKTATGMSIAGIATGAVGTLIATVVFVLGLFALSALNSVTQDITVEIDGVERSLEEYNAELENQNAELEELQTEMETL